MAMILVGCFIGVGVSVRGYVYSFGVTTAMTFPLVNKSLISGFIFVVGPFGVLVLQLLLNTL